MEEANNCIDKDLIELNKKLPPFRNSIKFLAAAKEFIHNKNIQALCVISEHSPVRRAVYEHIKKSANFPLTNHDASIPSESSLTDFLRKNVLFSIKSIRDVYEGEVSEIKIMRNNDGDPLWIDLSLRTAKATKQIKLTKNLLSAISAVNLGDIIYIEPSLGIIKRLGRSETRADEYDLEGDKYLQLSKGAVHAVKEKEVVLSLYDFDYAFNKYNSKISAFVRSHVDNVVQSYIELGIAKAIPSAIYIDSAQLLSVGDLTNIRHTINTYSDFKVVISGCNFSKETKMCIRDDFFTAVPDTTENIVDLIEYFSKRSINADLKDLVAQIVNFSNFESILRLLELTGDRNEFLEFYNMQAVGK